MQGSSRDSTSPSGIHDGSGLDRRDRCNHGNPAAGRARGSQRRRGNGRRQDPKTNDSIQDVAAADMLPFVDNPLQRTSTISLSGQQLISLDSSSPLEDGTESGNRDFSPGRSGSVPVPSRTTPVTSGNDSSGPSLAAIESFQLRLMQVRVKQLQESQAQKEALIAELSEELDSAKISLICHAREAKEAIAQSAKLEREIQMTVDRQAQLDQDLRNVTWEVKRIKGRTSDVANNVDKAAKQAKLNRLENNKTRDLQIRAEEDVAKFRDEMGLPGVPKRGIPPKGTDIPNGKAFVQADAPDEMPFEQDWENANKHKLGITPSIEAGEW